MSGAGPAKADEPARQDASGGVRGRPPPIDGRRSRAERPLACVAMKRACLVEQSW
jgi:hypothetical protein